MLIALYDSVTFPVPFPTSIVTVYIPRPPEPTQALESINVLHVVADVYWVNGVAVGVWVGVFVGVGVDVFVGVCEGKVPHR